MSLAAGQAIIQMLIIMEHHLKLEENLLYQQKMLFQKQVSGFMSMQSSSEPGSQAFRALEAQISRLNNAETIIDKRLSDIQSRQKAVSSRRESLEGEQKNDIQRRFRNPYQ